jgi:prevent-host-death family protein
METVGVRTLKEQTSGIIRRVREQGEVINVTHRGQVVARIIPVRAPVPPDTTEAAWAALDALAAEIGAKWPAGVSALDAVREGRREL